MEEGIENLHLQGKDATAAAVAADAGLVPFVEAEEACVRAESVVEFAPEGLDEVAVFEEGPLRFVLCEHCELSWVVVHA